MGKKHEVLVVEDDGVILQLLTELLSVAGYTCTCATSCDEARKIVAEHKFSCGLIDLGLPCVADARCDFPAVLLRNPLVPEPFIP